jgi:hypothetical protein
MQRRSWAMMFVKVRAMNNRLKRDLLDDIIKKLLLKYLNISGPIEK